MIEEKTNRTDEIRSLLKKRTSKLFIVVLLCLIAIPPIVHVIVLLVSGAYLLQAGDILMYWGSIVAFAGTATLALVAWKQNESSEETNKRLANTNDKLVELNEKMQGIQMANSIAIFDISNVSSPSLRDPINKGNYYSFLLNFDIHTILGIGLNCKISLNQYYSSIDLAEDIIISLYDNLNPVTLNIKDQKDYKQIKRFIKYANLEWAISIPKDALYYNCHSFVAVFHIEHDDIMGDHHSDIITVVYSNTTTILQYEGHHVYSPEKLCNKKAIRS